MRTTYARATVDSLTSINPPGSRHGIMQCTCPNTCRRSSSADFSSTRRVTAVDYEFRAGDETRLVRGQVHHAPGDIVRLAHVPERMQRADVALARFDIALVAEIVVHHRRPDEAGMDGIEAD